MKASVLCLILLTFASSTLAQGDDTGYYSRRYDSIDVNTIFRSSRLLNNYVDCLLDKKPCPPEGKDLKKVLPDALRTRCSRCTKVQKQKALDVITRLYYEHSSIYTDLAIKYDPNGVYTRNFESWFDEQNAVKPQTLIPEDNLQPDRVTANANDLSSSTQQAVRRSPDIDAHRNSNKIASERARIPTTWVTLPNSTTTTTTTTRVPLRTTPFSMRSTARAASITLRPSNPTFFIDNIFTPRPNGAITQSINRLLDSTEKVVNNVGQIFRSTFEIITGPFGRR